MAIKHLASILGVICLTATLKTVTAKNINGLPDSITGKIDLSVNEKLRIIDSDGRERIFHGVNVVVKGPPYHPSTETFDSQWSFCEEDMKLVQAMGYNVIRLSVPWAGVEPQDGVFNETYLAKMTSIIDAAAAHGIYTLIDFHQDAWNAKFCGNGVPDWAAIADVYNFPEPLYPQVPVDPLTGHPTRATCDDINGNNWSEFYLSESTSSAVGAVYDNKFGLRDKFIRYWQKLASTFGNSSYIIGYELMNEPFAGNVYEDPLLLIPGVADNVKLQPLYDLVNDAIREIDDNHLILFQGVTWQVVVPIGEEYGFQHAPGGQQYRNRSVLSWHGSVMFTPEEEYFGWKQDEMKRLQVGGFMTEMFSRQFNLMDQNQISGMHWGYKWFANLTWDSAGYFLHDGYNACKERTNMTACWDLPEIKTFARTYNKAVAGHVQNFTFDPETLVAKLEYVIEPECKLPTVIFFSEEFHYTNGIPIVTIEPANAATWTYSEKDHIIITHNEPIIAINLIVTLSPAPTVIIE